MTSTERFKRIMALFQAVMDLPAEQRETFLDRECAGDPALRAEVTALLEQDAKRASEQAGPTGPAAQPSRAPGILGDYQIVREIGRGGMGVVYLAEQRSLRRHVALKVLPPHLTLSDTAITRFRREASTAARLRHPGI